MWRSYGHCFNCQIDFENKLTLMVNIDEWVKNVKERKNKLWIRDQKER